MDKHIYSVYKYPMAEERHYQYSIYQIMQCNGNDNDNKKVNNTGRNYIRRRTMMIIRLITLTPLITRSAFVLPVVYGGGGNVNGLHRDEHDELYFIGTT